ncbi:MAG: CNNM domain-containing protein [Alphaproteobacteria bacterium]
MAEIIMSYFPQMIFILILLAFSGFFSAAETAIASASLPRMVTIAREKKSNAARGVIGILRNKERMITVMLLCNNLLNIFLSAYFTFLMTSIYGARGVAIAATIISFLIIVFAEIVPKNIAIYMADKMVLSLAYPLVFINYTTRPLTMLIERMNRWVIFIFRLKKDHASERDDELRGVIEMQTESDKVEKHEKLMLQSILNLADNALDSAMTHRNSVKMISTAWPQKRILADITQSRYSYIPLYEDDPDKIVGVFYVKSLLKKNPWQNVFNKKQLLAMASDPWFVPVSTTLAHQLQAFRETGNHFAIVIDEYGIFKGVVTLEDILSEIVGEINDNIGKHKKDMERAADGSVMVKGTVTVRNLNRAFGWNLPEKGINTIAGLLLREAKIVPDVGVGITAFGFHFIVMAVEKQQIKSIKIKKLKSRKSKRKIALLPMV